MIIFFCSIRWNHDLAHRPTNIPCWQSVEILGVVFHHYGKEVLQKIYFGNWLRDYSQAMDVTLMNKLGGDVDSILTIVMLLAFKEFPSGAGAFKVTSDKLRVYLPVEHIDNPKVSSGR